MGKKILFLTLLFLTSLFSFGQLDVKKNYRKPYFQGSIEVKDTLRVDNLFQLKDGSLIKSELGNASLEFRQFGFDYITLRTSLAGVVVTDFGVSISTDIDLTQTQKSDWFLGPNSIYITLDDNTANKQGSFFIQNNEASDVSNAFNKEQFPGEISSKNYLFKQGVINSFAGGGEDIILKTDNTSYSNQFGFNNGLAGEMILAHTPNAGNFTATLKAESGTIAYLSDVSASSGNFIKNIISPGTLTSDVDNWSPVGYDDETDLIRIDINNNNREITGIVAPSPGVNRILGVTNLNNSGDDIRFTNNDASSSAANRFLLRDSAQKSIKPNETAWFWYDHLSSRWRPFNRVG